MSNGGRFAPCWPRSPRRQATILLMWAEDLSYAEIAAAIGVQPSSVGSLLRRAQDAFKKEYEARYGHAS